MQTIDILGDQVKIGLGFEVGERYVRRVRFASGQMFTAPCIEIPHMLGIVLKGFRGGEILRPMPSLYTVRSTEGGYAALCRDESTSRNSDGSAHRTLARLSG